MKGRSGKINSAIVIARLISAEGFNDHVANQVGKYYREAIGLTDRQKKKITRLSRELSRIAQEKLSEGDRHVLGRFIGLHKKMSFDVGLRVGLGAFSH